MKRAVVNGYKAPHKPILLLSVAELIECDKIKGCEIELNDDLILKFKELWRQYVDSDDNETEIIKVGEELMWEQKKTYPFKCNIANPYFHLSNEPFWTLEKNEKWIEKSFYNIKSLREFYESAKLDDQLYTLIKKMNRGRL